MIINRLDIRRLSEEREKGLSPFAVKSYLSKGRLRPEEPCPVRTAFQRDRDRIIHCKAFLRLKHKTQVFIAPAGDHYTTRMTHTLEVSQIARTIARALNLNEDLAEAISLGHDLGHTPFGHVGEDMLDELYSGGFRHNEQSLRVVDVLENDGTGLNLNWEVRDGILNHSKSRANVLGADWGKVGTYEGEICKLADIIAYINHDIDDAVRAGIIKEDDLPAEATALLGHCRSERVNAMVCDTIARSWAASGRVEGKKPVGIGMGSRVLKATAALRDFLFARVYNVRSIEKEAGQARQIIRGLYDYFTRHPEQMPPGAETHPERRVVDYIAGMTDLYAMTTAEKLGITQKG